jgi:aspartate aminotransferase
MNITPYLRVSKHSQTLLINQASLTRAKNKQTVYKFGFGQSPFPVPSEISQALANAAHRKEYMSVQGHLPLREAVVAFHQHQENKNWHSDNIIVGAGSKILLFCVMAAFEQAEILLPAPSWVSYEPQGKLAGHNVTWLTTNFSDNWQLTPQQLDDYCLTRTKPELPLILVFNYPSNPTGQSYSREQLSALAKVMRKHNIIVIADEIYSLLTFNKNYATLDEFYPEGCIVSSGLSKWCGAGGWRLGFMHIPPQLKGLLATVIGVASETYSCAPAPIQIAASYAYSHLELANDFLTKQTGLLNEISQYCTARLQKIGVKVHAAQGGFYLFPDFSAFKEKLAKRQISTSEQLTIALMEETGVALLPGSAFGMPTTSLTARLAFVDFDGQQVFAQASKQYNFDQVKQGIAQLCNWLIAL